MNEYNVKVNFKKGLIQTNLNKLVQNDYNSTKLNFTFDKEGRVLFKLLRPDNSQYVDEIVDNTLIFGPGILSKDGKYTYEISLYTEDGRLTATKEKSFDVRHEIVNTDEIVEIDDRLPILDNLISEANEINNIDVDIEDSVITLKRKDGTTKIENVKGDAYEITEEDYKEIENDVIGYIQPTLANNLEEAKSYADSIKPTKTSELTNDSSFAVTNQNNNFSVSQTINGTLTINGDIVQNGENYVSHAEEVHTKNDEIITREGAIGGLSEGQYAGIQALLYDGTNNGRLGFNAAGEARVGDIGDEQPLLTRDEIINLEPGQVLIWDGENLRAVGSSEYVKNTDVASETAFGLVKVWTSINEDGEVGFNISTEV